VGVSNKYKGLSKYSGLVLPYTQQLWYRKALVDGRTTMSSESVSQVARNWVEGDSFHTHLFGVVVTCGNFHNGSEKGTASMHHILCQSWEKCYGDPHNESTWLWGPNLESHVGISMACPVQDRSHIMTMTNTQGGPQAAQLLKLLHE
jgi:hypothetical protein